MARKSASKLGLHVGRLGYKESHICQMVTFLVRAALLAPVSEMPDLALLVQVTWRSGIGPVWPSPRTEA